jgi:hypothetical protein
MRASKERARPSVQSLGKRGVTTRVPASVREAVVAYAQEARSAGRPWSEIVAQVGLSKTSVRRWMKAPRRREAQFKPVQVKMPIPEKRGLVLVTASGDRIEGLTVSEATTLLRGLR